MLFFWTFLFIRELKKYHHFHKILSSKIVSNVDKIKSGCLWAPNYQNEWINKYINKIINHNNKKNK